MNTPKKKPNSTLRIGDVALAAGVSRDALRFYETEGLIRSARASNGYRMYPAETVDLVRYVRTAQRLGFTLAEIKDSVPKLWKMGNTESEVVRLLTEKLKMVDRRIEELRELRDELKVRLDTACANRLAEKAPTTRAKDANAVRALLTKPAAPRRRGGATRARRA